MRCDKCKWSKIKKQVFVQPPLSANPFTEYKKLFCMRLPPGSGNQPTVASDDFCKEFSPKPETLPAIDMTTSESSEQEQLNVAADIAAKEREECANIVDMSDESLPSFYHAGGDYRIPLLRHRLADQIRARGQA